MGNGAKKEAIALLTRWGPLPHTNSDCDNL